jgi:hypothetical protein
MNGKETLQKKSKIRKPVDQLAILLIFKKVKYISLIIEDKRNIKNNNGRFHISSSYFI